MTEIAADHPLLRHEGRIDLANPREVELIYAGSSVRARFVGTSIAVRASNRHHKFENALGYVLDGIEGKIVLDEAPGPRVYPIAEGLGQGPHELVVFKRTDGELHYCAIHALILSDGARLLALPQPPERRIECYGDSVCSGEVVEANDYLAAKDPEDHGGRYSNSWRSFSMLTARELGAELHNNAQGGIAVLDGTGFFANRTLGLVSTWDKLRYNPAFGPATEWDFSRFDPHVVIMALGQNDSKPDDYIDADPARRALWKEAYAGVIKSLRAKRPRALFVVLTTIMNHEPGWDAALDEMVADLADPKVVRFRFTRVGVGTPGHPRVAEQEEMATELAAFLSSFGPGIWE
ncbi:MAG TPA: GDSL-type esterase/lipase family protein [Treponemataceae bacterium]|nr:GDSL-type esterase/lipase family protein [Treponemataceae bacterium]